MTTAVLSQKPARPAAHRRALNSSRPALLAAAGLIGLIALWQLLAWQLAQSMPLANLLTPKAAFTSLWLLLQSGALWPHIAASLERVGVALFWALTCGLPLGLLLGRAAWAEQLTGTAFQFLRMISPLSWMPIAVMILGIGNPPIYFLLAFAAVWPIVINTSAGVKSIRRSWLALGHSLAATRAEMLLHIVLPAVFGHVLTGLRMAIGVVWIVLVPCEMLGVNEGLGYFILDTRDRLAYSELMATVLVIGLLGWALDSAARLLHKRFAGYEH